MKNFLRLINVLNNPAHTSKDCSKLLEDEFSNFSSPIKKLDVETVCIPSDFLEDGENNTIHLVELFILKQSIRFNNESS